MRTKLVIKYLFCLLLSSLMYMPAYAQDDMGDGRTISEIMNSITRLKKEIAEKKTEKKKYESYLKIYKDSIPLVTEEIKRIDALLKRENLLRSSVAGSKNEKKRYEESKANKTRLLTERRNTLETAQTAFRNMAVYERIRVLGIYEQNWTLLRKKYSSITDEEIKQISQNVEQFRGFTKFEEYQKRVAAAVKNRQLYKDANAAINSKYDEGKVNRLRDQLYPLLFETPNDIVAAGRFKLYPEQHSELDSLDIKLSRYKGGIEALKSIVDKVNSNQTIADLRLQKKDKDCLEEILKIVQPDKNSETRRFYDRYFKEIPYLKGLFDAYVKSLNLNPLEVGGDAEKKIKEM